MDELKGASELGDAFVRRAEPFVWPDVLDPAAVHEVRAMKARMCRRNSQRLRALCAMKRPNFAGGLQ